MKTAHTVAASLAEHVSGLACQAGRLVVATVGFNRAFSTTITTRWTCHTIHTSPFH